MTAGSMASGEMPRFLTSKIITTPSEQGSKHDKLLRVLQATCLHNIN
jgi:hypothetical protein